MISLDSSILPAIAIFLLLVFALNRLLFRPLLRIQEERGSRTTGLEAKARTMIEHQTELFDRYQAAVKGARMDGYRRQEQVRSEALARRSAILAEARQSAESLIQQSRATIQAQSQAARAELGREAQEIARGIAASILRRSA
jgi:F-type H+-transporting ATPase subunit b